MDYEYCDKQFDDILNKFTLHRLPWLPWIGDKYKDSANRLMIVGESHYGNWRTGWDANSSMAQLKDPNFTRFVVKTQALNCQATGKMYRNLERVIFNKTYPADEKKEKLWRSVCYHNLILKPMENIKHRPTWENYLEGWGVFFDLMEVLKPTRCLVAGSSQINLNSFQIVADQRNAKISERIQSDKISGTHGEKLDVNSDKLSFRLVFIMHPSGRNFSWFKWHPFTSNFIPNPFI